MLHVYVTPEIHQNGKATDRHFRLFRLHIHIFVVIVRATQRYVIVTAAPDNCLIAYAAPYSIVKATQETYLMFGCPGTS